MLESGGGKKLIGKCPSLLIKVMLEVSGLGLNGGCHREVEESNFYMLCQTYRFTLLVLSIYDILLILVLPVN